MKLKYTKSTTAAKLASLDLKDITFIWGDTGELRHKSQAYVSQDESYCVLAYHDLMIPRPGKGVVLPLYRGLMVLLSDTRKDDLVLHPEIWAEYVRTGVITRAGYLRDTPIRSKSLMD
jgi:hypothetical protein